MITLPNWSRSLLVESLPNPEEVLLAANRSYERPPFASVEAYQLAWADRNGRFPGDPESSDSGGQPRPGTFTA